ncbi:MAG: type II toxin-antitoxin system RelE/ParE family toxin [Roseburia sp.]|nr:type II toxin-antitoxin system RelE/ParE family toxin [Roseburia sp.]
MAYKVKITPLAVSQLKETVTYISETLLVPEIAAKWLDLLKREISTLDSLPNRFPLTDEEPWRSKGVRKQLVKGFIVYYLVDKNQSTVTVIAVVYGRRDQVVALSNIDI